ncbi:MAG: RpiB/LacA/LacB family sugar-phosphate isomerase [Christensenellales bacterium]|jgi:ribose 5-phosphate isomerase B
MKIIIGSDKSGFNLKEEIKTHLTDKGYEVADRGTLDVDNFLPYYKVAAIVAKAIQDKEFEKGILVCGTGAGMCIVANKFKGVYAVCAESGYTAKMSSVINRANVLTLGGWVVQPQLAVDMIDRWLTAEFADGFPADRKEFLENAYKSVGEIENNNFKG